MLREMDRRLADAMLADDASATVTIGRWLPIGAGAGLVVSLFVKWYSLSIGAAGTAVRFDLASTALQWLPLTSWLLASAGLIVAGLSAWRAWAGATPVQGLGERGVNRVQIGLALLAAAFVVFRIADPPSLPGSSAHYHLQGQLAVGPFIALLLIFLMLLGLWVQRAELLAGS